MLLFIPRSLCALKRVAAKAEHARFGATQGIRIALASGLYRAEATDGHRAMVVQGLMPSEDPPWPGFKDLPDDACEAVVLPKDLERACKVGDDYLQRSFGMLGIATMGNDVCLGLGSELVTARTVEGRFPNINQVIPKKRPLFTFRVDPKILAETLLAMAELLPEGASGCPVLLLRGGSSPLGFCA
jgi:DNA polymerase III sliding clamp (beta) subunit (PCNA family)